MQYNYGNDTLLHSVKFDFFKLESILKYGILSYNEALKRKIPYSRTYDGYNGGDYISLVRYIYVNRDDIEGSYDKHIINGISLIIESTPYVYNKEEIYINHADEVYVKDYIPTSNIVGINIPESYLDKPISSLPIIRLTTFNYSYIKKSCDNIINYLKSYGYEIDVFFYNLLLTNLYNLNNLYKDDQREETKQAFREMVEQLQDFMAECYEEAFCNYFNKDEVSLREVVEYISHKYGNLPIYVLKDNKDLTRK